ncbi:hypothetical protein EDC04DRAFT_2755811 [Pisolithus marmoratus]|nr:hypothetical protein EDC04DRAFT_2755811 [Pisolithus marmoratus]
MSTSTQCTTFTLQLILAFRVFALFGRRPWVLRLLGCVILAQLLCRVPLIISDFESYGSSILFRLSPKTNIQMAFGMAMHSTLIILTVIKHSLSLEWGVSAGK